MLNVAKYYLVLSLKKKKKIIWWQRNCNIYTHKIYVLISIKHKNDHKNVKLHILKIQNNYLYISNDLKSAIPTHTEMEKRVNHNVIFLF